MFMTNYNVGKNNPMFEKELKAFEETGIIKAINTLNVELENFPIRGKK